MNKTLKIRFAINDDLPRIVEIYNQAIKMRTATGDMDKFSVEERFDWFSKFNSHNHPIYVAEKNKKVIGYATISPYRHGRRAMDKIAEISFFLDYSYLKQGIGSLILQYVISDCKRLGKETLIAILLDINVSSIRLLKKFNFQEWGNLPNVIDFDGKKASHLIYGLKLSI